MAQKIKPPRREWLTGRHAVRESLKAGGGIKLLIQRGQTDAEMRELAREARAAGVEVEYVPRQEIDRLCPRGRHQGLALEVEKAEAVDLGGFVAKLSDADKAGALLVALDEIQDPHNLGAIARSAVNLGAKALILCDRRAAPVNEAAVRASAGAISRLPILTAVNLGQALKTLKESGFWIYGADMEGRDVWDVQFNRPLCLVIGSEGHGLREPVKNACDELVRIPQSAGGVESLNASCAASVLLYEAARQRR